VSVGRHFTRTTISSGNGELEVRPGPRGEDLAISPRDRRHVD